MNSEINIEPKSNVESPFWPVKEGQSSNLTYSMVELVDVWGSLPAPVCFSMLSDK
jgi:hypothetical protein